MRVLIGFASMSGNTEEIMLILKEILEEKNCHVEVMEMDTIAVSSLTTYNLLLLGSYTWGDGDLPYEIEDFYEKLETIMLAGVPAACFGSGDTDYPEFCRAIELIADRLKERGADVFRDLLKIELSPDTDEAVAECKQFAHSVYNWAKLKEENDVY